MNKRSKQKGKLITLEGIEGAGKTTHLKTIQRFLSQQDIDVVITREPGGTELGHTIREWLLSSNNKPSPETELCLLFADRAEHVDKVIIPALATGQWVVSDRFVDASFAYQGGGRGISHEIINSFSQYVCQGLVPDMTLLFDIPLEIAYQRIAKRSNKDRFELEDTAFFCRVQNAYLDLMKQDSVRWKRIDTTDAIEQVSVKIEELLRQFINKL